MITVVIADDHNLVRQGIRALLERTCEIKVVGEADNGLTAAELVQRHQPDVLVTDIAMSALNGIELIKHITAARSRTKIVVLSMYFDETLIRQALHHGARGYVLKSSLSEDLILAVHAMKRGETFLSSELPAHLAVDPAAPLAGTTPFDGLTPREREVLQLIIAGATNKMIAGKLTISERTVEKHRSQLMRKLKVTDLASLVRLAHGLTSP